MRPMSRWTHRTERLLAKVEDRVLKTASLSTDVLSADLRSDSEELLVFFRRRLREDSGSLSPPCFCYGHSSQCSAQSGYSVHTVTSTFTNGNLFTIKHS